MDRRSVLTGLAAGIPLLAGCSTLLESSTSGDESSDGKSNDDGVDQTKTPDTTPTLATSSTPETPADVVTTATDIAQQTATQAAPTTSTYTPTTTSTYTSTPTMTQTTTTSTPVRTVEGPDETSVSRRIEQLDFTTYTNSKYSYSIKRPVQWDVTTSDSSVMFVGRSGSSIIVSVNSNITPSMSLTQFVTRMVRSMKQSGDNTILNQQKVSLSNGTPAIVLDSMAVAETVKLRQKVLYTFANGNIYIALISIPESIYSSKIEKMMNSVLLSLTIG